MSSSKSIKGEELKCQNVKISKCVVIFLKIIGKEFLGSFHRLVEEIFSRPAIR